MPKYLIHTLLLLSLLLLVGNMELDAQCAMCKATAESATESIDESIGEGLNNGILYLMGIPYALLLIAVFVFFRKPLARFYRELSHQGS